MPSRDVKAISQSMESGGRAPDRMVGVGFTGSMPALPEAMSHHLVPCTSAPQTGKPRDCSRGFPSPTAAEAGPVLLLNATLYSTRVLTLRHRTRLARGRASRSGRSRRRSGRRAGRAGRRAILLERRRVLQFVLGHRKLQLGICHPVVAGHDIEGLGIERHVLRADTEEAADAN